MGRVGLVYRDLENWVILLAHDITILLVRARSIRLSRVFSADRLLKKTVLNSKQILFLFEGVFIFMVISWG